jgi:peptidyl-prolyl cis-trans isomerase A (cyclophilin A)
MSSEAPLLLEAVSSVATATLLQPPAPARAFVVKHRLAAARRHSGAMALLVSLLAPLAACQSGKVPEPTKEAKPATPAPSATPAAAGGASTATVDTAAADRAAAARAAAAKAAAERPQLREPVFQKVQAKPVAEVKPAAGDPVQGKFGMEDALKGLPGKGTKVVAELTTSDGKLECELWPDKAPITVANFIGLARGTRPWKKGNSWVKQPLYDGTVIHRVVKGFMVQGGDPEGNGHGGPGYAIPDEIWEDAHHDQRGLLCMANSGPNTNGSQFFIMDGPAAHLDGQYTIFGKCGPDDVVQKLANTPTQGDRAIDPPKISKVVVRRGAS